MANPSFGAELLEFSFCSISGRPSYVTEMHLEPSQVLALVDDRHMVLRRYLSILSTHKPVYAHRAAERQTQILRIGR